MTPDDDHQETAPDASEPRSSQSVPNDAEWEMIVQRPFGPAEDDGLTTAVVFAVAEAEGISPRDVHPPLYEVIDPSALEAAMYRPGEQSSDIDAPSTTEFMYRGYRIVVQNDGWVRVHERSE